MNAGAATASSDVLLFLHADTVLPDNADGLVLYGLADTGRIWGRFDVEIEGKNPLLALVAGLMNWRSQITGIATGDQAMFMTHDAFKAVGGFDDIPLMEDIASVQEAQADSDGRSALRRALAPQRGAGPSTARSAPLC